jgi:succinate dehydrogenase / fumarate reductase, cytochrome b subunit
MGTPAMPETFALWVSRLVLLGAVLLHIHSAYSLTIMNRQARPIGYRDRSYLASTYAARTMRWGGVIIALYVVYHLAHLTTGQVHHDFVKDDVYHNVVTGFRVWWVSAIYMIANLALGLHLYHGLWSMFNSLGLNHPRYNNWKRYFASAFALLITVVNLSFPIAVLAGWVR